MELQGQLSSVRGSGVTCFPQYSSSVQPLGIKYPPEKNKKNRLFSSGNICLPGLKVVLALFLGVYIKVLNIAGSFSMRDILSRLYIRGVLKYVVDIYNFLK
ncbi:MAG: hypothetical protein ACQEUT_16565 [Bacillota bacterium]